MRWHIHARLIWETLGQIKKLRIALDLGHTHAVKCVYRFIFLKASLPGENNAIWLVLKIPGSEPFYEILFEPFDLGNTWSK